MEDTGLHLLLNTTLGLQVSKCRRGGLCSSARFRSSEEGGGTLCSRADLKLWLAATVCLSVRSVRSTTARRKQPGRCGYWAGRIMCRSPSFSNRAQEKPRLTPGQLVRREDPEPRRVQLPGVQIFGSISLQAEMKNTLRACGGRGTGRYQVEVWKRRSEEWFVIRQEHDDHPRNIPVVSYTGLTCSVRAESPQWSSLLKVKQTHYLDICRERDKTLRGIVGDKVTLVLY